MYLITYKYRLKTDKTLEDFKAYIEPFITILENHSAISMFVSLNPESNIILSGYIVKDLNLWLKYANGPKAKELLMFLKDVIDEFMPLIKITDLLKKSKFEIYTN